MFQIILSMLLTLGLASSAVASPISAQGHGDAWQYGTGGGIIGFIVLILDIIIIRESISFPQRLLTMGVPC